MHKGAYLHNSYFLVSNSLSRAFLWRFPKVTTFAPQFKGKQVSLLEINTGNASIPTREQETKNKEQNIINNQNNINNEKTNDSRSCCLEFGSLH